MSEDYDSHIQFGTNDPLIFDNFKHEILQKEKKTDLIKLEKPLDIEKKYQKNINESAIDKLSTSTKVLFSLPAFSKMSCLLILNVHAMIFYENKGSSLLLMSFFTAFARCLELILKPLIAHWSDNSNFPKGRRKPFMLVGCGFYALFLVFVFTPPYDKMSPIFSSIWFGSFYVLFFVADTVSNIPYQALGPELSPDTREREKLYMLFYFFQYIGVLFASVAPVLIVKLFNYCDCKSCTKLAIHKIEECMTECHNECDVGNTEKSLIYMCMFVGLFYVFSIILLCNSIKENKNFSKHEKSYLIPTLFRMINNQPFISLLIPWIIDVTITQIFATMLPFFVTYIINPQKYCMKNKIDINSNMCNVNNWIGLTIFVFFIFCIGFMGLWHIIVQYIGKKKVWQAYSLISIVSFSLLLVCDEGNMTLMVVIAAINAFPAGGGYLNDVFISDIIDYDEFVTGKRNEGIYMVFSSFTPKIVGIFAQSIPLCIMSLIGYVPAYNGQIQDQPQSFLELIRFYFIAIPVFLALISFLYKLKFPIDTENKMLELKSTIKLQNEMALALKENYDFYKIKNPIYGSFNIQIFCKTASHKETKIVADHFSDVKYLKLLLKNEYNEIKKKLICILITFFAFFIFFLILLIATFQFMNIKSLSFVPLICLFILTFTLLCIIINAMRLRVINKVIANEYEIDEKYLTLYLYQMKINLGNEKGKDSIMNECGGLKNDCST